MKFFTPEVYEAADSDDSLDWAPLSLAYEACLAHVKDLRAKHPSDVWDIADPFFVDDALVVSVRYDRTKRTMEFILRCGNLQIGYFDLVLNYEGVEISPESEFALATVAHATL